MRSEGVNNQTVDVFRSTLMLDLETALEAAGKTFETNRYFYEKSPDSNYGLQTLPQMLKEHIMMLKPDWIERGDEMIRTGRLLLPRTHE